MVSRKLVNKYKGDTVYKTVEGNIKVTNQTRPDGVRKISTFHGNLYRGQRRELAAVEEWVR